jgi:tetratricopeptide (TPR) repeat protein
MRRYLHLFLLLATGVMFPAIQRNPKDLQAMLKNAERELDWQFFADAKRSYLEILRQYPQLLGLNEALGYICLMQQKYDESFGYFEKELEQEPYNDLSRLLLGIAHFQAGDTASARKLIAKIISNQSYIGNETFNQSKFTQSKKKFLKKYPFFKKFMSDNPGLIPFVVGILYKERDEWGYAEKMMDEAVKQKYCLAEVMVQLVDQYLQQQDSAAAAFVLSKLEHQNFQLAGQMIEIVKSQDRQKAREYARSRPIIIRYFKESISTIVDDLNKMAQNAVKRADPESAIKTWKKALFADDNRFIIHYNIALIYYLHKFPQEGFYHCRRAIDLGDSRYQPWALNLAGNIQFAMANFNQALYYYQQAISLAPDYLKCRNNLGATYWKLGDLANAEREWRRVIKNSGRGGKESDVLELNERENIKVLVDVKESDEMIEAGKSLAALYLQQKQVARAMPLLEMVLQFIPSDADAHFELGKIHMQLHNLALARQHLEAAIKNGTTFATEARNLFGELEKKMK